MMRSLVVALILCLIAAPAAAARIKDIATLRDASDSQLVGYGLVVGLSGTGDTFRNTPFTQQADYGFNNGSAASSSKQPAKILGDLSSSSATQGQGNIDRSEQIQVSVAAVVTRVLPNGNLVISGSQEVRVNYELRQLTVAGIVRPSDVSLNNTISYDHIAEARVSYGGRGRESDFQQPSWGQQIYDAVRPF